MFATTYLHSNLLIASFQLLGWLLFHPTAWQSFVSQIDKTLPPDFTFSDISSTSYQHPNLRRLRLIAFVVLPILVGVLVGILLTIAPLIPWFFSAITDKPYAFPKLFGTNLITGISYGTIICFVGSIFSSIIISIPFAIVASVLAGISVGFFMALKLYAWTIISVIFAISIAGSVTTHWYCKNNKCTVIGSLVIGTIFGAICSVVVGIILLGIVLVVGAGVGYIFVQLWPNIKELQEYAKMVGMAVACGLFVGGYLQQNWRDSLKWGLLFGFLMLILIALIVGVVHLMPTNSWSKRLLVGITKGTINTTVFVLLFAIPYLLARHFANIWAGVIAGVLSSGGIYLGIILTNDGYSKYLLVWGLVFFGLGLSQKFWLSIISYPFELAWNLLINQAQKRNPERTINLLPWHSAFWNEQQHLPLFGLETLLVKVYEHDVNLGQRAILHLSNTPQNWAVQATQIESNTQILENCHNIQEIAQVHKKLIVNDDLDGIAGDWLRNFNKNSQTISTAFKQNNYQQITTLDNVINNIEGILTLTGSKQSKEEQRFRTIANNWLHLLNEHAQKLKGMQEIYNPYIIGIPLENGQDVFIPRPNINARIKRLLANRSAPPLLLYGQRRTGKTSLLKNLHTQLPDNFIMLFVDCQGTLNAAQNQLSFFYNLGRLIIKAANKHYPDLALPYLTEDMVRSDPVTRFDEWLDAVEIAIGNKIILFALDEFITLDNAFNDGRLEIATILGMFRNIIQHRPQFRLLLSGTHTLKELQHWASYLINVQTVHMNYLTEDEAKHLIERPMENFPLNYTDEATQKIMDLTNKQPAFIQLLCGELVQIKDGQTVDKRLFVQITDVEIAIIAAFEHGSIVFTDIEQNQIDDDGRNVLKFMAAQSESVSREQLATLAVTDLDKTIELLLLREIIEVAENGYCFQIELVRRWFLSEKL